MLNEKATIKTSKFLSLVLRHSPDTIGITLDENGWTDVPTLIEQANKNGVHLDLPILEFVVDTNTKKRFAFNADKSKIRANQGHSVEVELGYQAKEPPAILYHGTGKKSVDSILQNGLDKRQRHHVHLSSDLETATAVGKRHGEVFIFEVLAQEMFLQQHDFYLSDNGVWLTEHVPTQFLRPMQQHEH